MTDSTNSLRTAVDVGHIAGSRYPSLCVTTRYRTRVTVPERFLKNEICRGSTASKGRCPPGALALHPLKLQGELVLLDSHLLM